MTDDQLPLMPRELDDAITQMAISLDAYYKASCGNLAKEYNRTVDEFNTGKPQTGFLNKPDAFHSSEALHELIEAVNEVRGIGYSQFPKTKTALRGLERLAAQYYFPLAMYDVNAPDFTSALEQSVPVMEAYYRQLGGKDLRAGAKALAENEIELKITNVIDRCQRYDISLADKSFSHQLKALASPRGGWMGWGGKK